VRLCRIGCTTRIVFIICSQVSLVSLVSFVSLMSLVSVVSFGFADFTLVSLVALVASLHISPSRHMSMYTYIYLYIHNMTQTQRSWPSSPFQARRGWRGVMPSTSTLNNCTCHTHIHISIYIQINICVYIYVHVYPKAFRLSVECRGGYLGHCSCYLCWTSAKEAAMHPLRRLMVQMECAEVKAEPQQDF
jgi:hypothetical protein